MGPSQTTQYQQHVGLRIEGSHPFLQRHSCQRKAELAKAKKGRSRDLWGKFLLVIVSLFTFLLYYTQPPMYSLFVLARKCLTRKKLYIKRRKNKFFLWGSCCKWRLEYRTLEYQTFWSSVYQWSKNRWLPCLFVLFSNDLDHWKAKLLANLIYKNTKFSSNIKWSRLAKSYVFQLS